MPKHRHQSPNQFLSKCWIKLNPTRSVSEVNIWYGSAIKSNRCEIRMEMRIDYGNDSYTTRMRKHTLSFNKFCDVGVTFCTWSAILLVLDMLVWKTVSTNQSTRGLLDVFLWCTGVGGISRQFKSGRWIVKAETLDRSLQCDTYDQELVNC